MLNHCNAVVAVITDRHGDGQVNAKRDADTRVMSIVTLDITETWICHHKTIGRNTSSENVCFITIINISHNDENNSNTDDESNGDDDSNKENDKNT